MEFAAIFSIWIGHLIKFEDKKDDITEMFEQYMIIVCTIKGPLCSHGFLWIATDGKWPIGFQDY